jgi:molecular chaperone GrpE
MRNGAGNTGQAEDDSSTERTTDEVSELKEQIEDVRKELEKQTAAAKEYLDAARRIQAEFDNHKKRIQREREEFVKSANEKLIYELLPILDDFERALSASCSSEECETGICQIHDNLVSLLKSYGLEEISSKGKFDPQYHEALCTGEGDDGDILEVYQKGYFLGPRVLRHTKVKVGKQVGRGVSNDENNRN